MSDAGGRNARPTAEELYGEEWAEWIRLTPQERWLETERLWATFIALGGSLDPEPDPQSRFHAAFEGGEQPPDGGQACVLKAAAEFSRGTDIAVVSSQYNLERLHAALDDLGAQVIAVPPFDLKYLERGHAIRFRCSHPEALGRRMDAMSRMRGVDPFERL